MAEDTNTRKLIEAVVAEAFDQHVRALHDDLVGRVLATIDDVEKTRPERPVSTWLKSAVERIEASAQQTDILKALLEGTAEFCERAALFVLRGATAVMWQGRNFSDNDALRTISVGLGAGPCGTAATDRVLVTATASQVHQKFVDGTDRPCAVIPLSIREKVAALLYCDTAPGAEALDVCALELLASSAGKWVELQAFRKTAGAVAAPRAVTAAAGNHAASAPPNHMHTQTHTQTSPVALENGVHEAQVHSSAAVAPAPSAHATPAPGGNAMAVAGSAPEIPEHERELHKKARRFAKLLVDEIILYNREKVNEGRRNRDLYDRLKDDIDKSRATYEKRYGGSSAAKLDYFREAVVSGLAEHNMALLGSNFPR